MTWWRLFCLLDQVSDNEGRICGKVWDDEVRARANVDLPIIETPKPAF